MQELTTLFPNLVPATVIVAIIGYLGVRVTAKAQKESAKGPEWRGYVEELRTWTQGQLKARDEEINQLKSEVEGLRDKLNLWRGRYYIAVHYIRSLHLAYPASLDRFPVPDELEQDF
ncbi:hypothetical protein CIP107521_00725 [Corynebacterium diphtheriae]|nr:hypothetical protein CIP107521_00725 [Corynebacterium diphtheriae]